MSDPAVRLRGMLDRTLYVGLSTLVGTREDLVAHLGQHLDYMVALEADGTLFASGPFLADGATTGAGLTIVRARSREEAREILAADPLVRAGIRTVAVHEWHLMEGAITLTVRASARAGELP